jgi:hypothetical protein
MLKEISTLSQHWEVENTLTLSTIETWSSRHKMEERLKSGISISNLRQSEPDITTNLGISRVQEEQETCKSGVPTLDGSKYSNTKMNSL